jgi:hypothetical protein
MDDQATEATEAPAPAQSEPVAAVSPAPDVEVAQAAPTAMEALVATWMNDTLANGPIARSTECWNALSEAIPALIHALETA